MTASSQTASSQTTSSRTTAASGRRLLPVADGRATRSWVAAGLRSHRLLVAGALLVGIAAAAAAVLPAYAFAALVDRVLAGAPVASVVGVAGLLAGAAVVGGATQAAATHLTARLGESMLAALREQVVARAVDLPGEVVEQAGAGDLLARIGEDVATAGRTVGDLLPSTVGSVLTTAIGLVAMAGLDWRLGVAGSVAVPLYAAALRWYLPRSAPAYAEQRVAVAARSQALVESLTGAAVVRAHRLERRRLTEIAAAAGRARDLSLGVVDLSTRFTVRLNRAECAGLLLVLLTGYALVRANLVTVGTAAAGALLLHRLFDPIGTVLYSLNQVQATAACIVRLVGVLEVAPARPHPATPTGRPADTGLELCGVVAGYAGTAVLHGIDLRIAPGERLALVGTSGAGKTTLAAVAAGLLEPTAGVVKLGGAVLAGLDPELVRARVVVVGQDVHVFTGSVADNVRLTRPDAADDDVRAALARIGALGWVEGLDKGLATPVGQGGVGLTAVQAQELALARLVFCDPAVAVLDEATAEAGGRGARGLDRAAAAATAGRTTLVVAHRLTQAEAADRVAVLHHGRVVEVGTHSDLVARGGRYAELWAAWRA